MERMQRCTSTSISATAYNKGSSDQRYTFRPPAWLRSVTKRLSSTLTHSSTDAACLPQHQASSVSKAHVIPNPSRPIPQRELFLMSCMHRTQHHVNVMQDHIEEIETDRQLFRFLRLQLSQYRSQFSKFLSMRRVQKIYFIKVSSTSHPLLRMNNRPNTI